MYPNISEILQKELDLGKSSRLIQHMISIYDNPPKTWTTSPRIQLFLIKLPDYLERFEGIAFCICGEFSVSNVQMHTICDKVSKIKSGCSTRTKARRVLLEVIKKLNDNTFNDYKPDINMKCIFTQRIDHNPKSVPLHGSYGYIKNPEKWLGPIEQREFNPDDYSKNSVVITTSPFIVACFRSKDVWIWDEELQESFRPACEVYGSSYELLFKLLLKQKSVIPKSVVNEIKEYLNSDDDIKALNYIKTLGYSTEKAYLLKKLKDKFK